MQMQPIDEYTKVLRFCEQNSAALPEYMLQQSRDYQQGLFRMYETLLDAIPFPIAGKAVVDFGCKFGHLLPLLITRGCQQAMGVDIEKEYVAAGQAVFGKLYPNTRIVQSVRGYIPLEPECADLVIMNEVISHVNPTFLDVVWQETARILRPGGALFISDGNNAASASAREKLIELYDKWENGPDGARTDRDVVSTSFLSRRREAIRKRHPGLSAESVEYAARNTSGLFGEDFLRVIDGYAATGELVRRPYRRGACPASPDESGIVMERAFFPQQLEWALIEYGFEARQIVPPPVTGRAGALGPLKDLYAAWRHRLRAIVRPDWYRSAFEGFQIIATRKS